MANEDASCQNCTFYTKQGGCKQAHNMVVDYSKSDNPYCWHWGRKKKFSLKNIFKE